MCIVALKDLPFVPISVSTKRGETLSRQVPSPEGVPCKSTDETRLIILVTQGSTVLSPSVLICLAYDLLGAASREILE